MSELTLNKDLLLTINKSKENMYWDAKGNTFKILNNSLQESLSLAPIKILTILFVTEKYSICKRKFPKI
jgi:hypothetical protein